MAAVTNALTSRFEKESMLATRSITKTRPADAAIMSSHACCLASLKLRRLHGSIDGEDKRTEEGREYERRYKGIYEPI